MKVLKVLALCAVIAASLAVVWHQLYATPVVEQTETAAPYHRVASQELFPCTERPVVVAIDQSGMTIDDMPTQKFPMVVLPQGVGGF